MRGNATPMTEASSDERKETTARTTKMSQNARPLSCCFETASSPVISRLSVTGLLMATDIGSETCEEGVGRSCIVDIVIEMNN